MQRVIITAVCIEEPCANKQRVDKINKRDI